MGAEDTRATRMWLVRDINRHLEQQQKFMEGGDQDLVWLWLKSFWASQLAFKQARINSEFQSRESRVRVGVEIYWPWDDTDAMGQIASDVGNLQKRKESHGVFKANTSTKGMKRSLQKQVDPKRDHRHNRNSGLGGRKDSNQEAWTSQQPLTPLDSPVNDSCWCLGQTVNHWQKRLKIHQCQ